MKKLKLFEEYSEKLWFHIGPISTRYTDWHDSTHRNPRVDFNPKLASKIISSLSNDWTGRLFRKYTGIYLELRRSDGYELIIDQTADDWFICYGRVSSQRKEQLFKCDQEDGLLQFLKDNAII